MGGHKRVLYHLPLSLVYLELFVICALCLLVFVRKLFMLVRHGTLALRLWCYKNDLYLCYASCLIYAMLKRSFSFRIYHVLVFI